MSQVLTEEYIKSFYSDFMAGESLELLIEKYIAADIVWDNFLPENIPFNGSWKGLEEYVRYLTIMLEAIEMESFTINNIVIEGNEAVIFGDETSLVRATGRRYTMDWVHVLKIENGKFIYAREYNDTAAMTAAFPSTK